MRTAMRPSASILLAAVAALTLSGCASNEAVRNATTATEAWTDKVEVDTQPEIIRLGVHADGVSPNQATAVADFVGLWREDDGGLISVQTPVGASPRMVASVQAHLAAQGAPLSMIELVSYDAAGDPAAPIVVAFDRFTVDTPRCGQNWENLTKTRNNEAFGNFGCAVTANIAAQIANPQDLLRPRTMTPADAQRRATVLGKYRQGETTSSARDDQAAGVVSRAIN
jgi:pilus assembly protein CpaD